MNYQMDIVKMISIRKGDLETVVKLSNLIPEFINPHAQEVYEARITGVPHLILIAFVNEQAVGFKIGYERSNIPLGAPTTFYSWMGAVLPGFRRQNIALKLAEYQEEWAKQQKYSSITFKTRNQHKNMLIFAIRRGFNIVGFKVNDDVLTNRILLRKPL